MKSLSICLFPCLAFFTEWDNLHFLKMADYIYIKHILNIIYGDLTFSFLNVFIYLMCMDVWFSCKCTYIMCVSGTNVGQKRELDSLSLELHTVVHSHGQAANGLNS